MNGIEEALKKKGVYIGKTEGDSMKPMLSEGKDTVVIVPPLFPLKKYDVPVYRRLGHYTMHRIIRVTRRGYVICGDNRAYPEKDITDRDIVGVLDSFYHNGKLVQCTDPDYIRYARRVCRMYPIRRFKVIMKAIARRGKKVFGKN